MHLNGTGDSLLRVLCLEDSPQDAELMEEMLGHAGFTVKMDRIATEEDFQTLLRNDVYDVILADFSLPGFDGRSALEWAVQNHPGLPFICVSGTIGEDTAVELLKQGASDYVLKDRMGRLGFSVRRALENAREYDARRRAEEALRQSQEIFRQLTENSHDVIFTIREDGIFTYESQSGLALQGYEPSQVIGRHFGEFVHPEDVERCITALDRVTATGDRFAELEYRARHEDGSWHWYSTNLMPIRDRIGNVAAVVGNGRDITSAKRMESRLALQATRLGALVDLQKLSDESDEEILDCAVYSALKVAQSKHAWIALADRASSPGDVPVWSEEAMTHDAISQLLRSRVGRVCEMDDFLRLRKPVVIGGGPGERGKELDGACAPDPVGSLLYVPVSDGEEIAAVAAVAGKGAAYDDEDASALVTLATKMWEVIRRRQDQQRISHLNRVLLAIRNVNQLIVNERDPQRLVQETCKFLVRTRGYDGAMIVTMDEDRRPVLFAEAGMPKSYPLVAERLREGIIPACFECAQAHDGVSLITDRSGVCASCPMGTDWPNSDTMSVRMRHAGRTYGFLAVALPRGIGKDPEERSIFSELAGDVAFALHNIQLEEMARRAKERRRRAEAQLRQAQKMEALGTLAGGVAHDFNNILGIIAGYAEMARWDIPATDPTQEHLQEVIKAANRARDLVKQILAFTRQSVQEKKPIRIGPVVREVLKMLRASIPSTIEIRSDTDNEATVVADPTQVHQVLMNLCANAAHAMSGNGGVLDVRVMAVCLSGEAVLPFPDLKPGRYVQVVVRDTGHGIDPAIMDRIFDPFFTTKGQGIGTGLGLSVVLGIVRSHGGAIDVESTPGMGTTFRVFFPEMKSAGASEGIQAEPLPKGHERVLVVDDEPALASLLKTMLEHLGYSVICMTDSIEALETFRNQPMGKEIDMAVTDMTMPHLTGAGLAAEMRRLKPDIPIILCTGYHETMDAEKAALLGFQGFLMKPVDLKVLANVVRKVADERVKARVEGNRGE